jgi:peptide chain release factor 2
MSEPGFWDNQERAQDVVQQVKQLRTWIDPFDALAARVQGARELAELLDADPMRHGRPSSRRAGRDRGELDAFELKSLLQGPDDARDAQVEISAGAGGTEAQDWAQMLMRMYTRWAERRGFDGRDPRPERGRGGRDQGRRARDPRPVRVRLPPARDGRAPPRAHLAVRRTGAAAHELRVGVRLPGGRRHDQHRGARGGHQDGRLPRVGAGGQHVNKTSSAVRLTHVPTGVVVSSQQERSQFKNRATAMKMLKNKLYNIELDKQLAAKAAIDATKTDVSFGSQIRSYVFQPYTMVNDHRTELKIPDVQKVMDGAIDPFIEAYLKQYGVASGAGRGA